MKNIQKIRDWLLENAIDHDGNLMLNDLDFSNFDGDVYIGAMKVKGNLIQTGNEVQGNLTQNEHEVQGYLTQSDHTVKGDLYQGFHRVQGSYYSTGIEVGGDIVFEEPIGLLKEITLEELKELGYTLKKENKKWHTTKKY